MSLEEYLQIEIFTVGQHSITLYMLILPLVFLLLARVTNWLLLRYLMRPYFVRMEFSVLQRQKIRRLFAGVLYFFSLWLSIELLFVEPEETPDFWQKLMPILQIFCAAMSILFGFQFIIWLLNDVILARYFRIKGIDLGRQYTVTRLVLYIGFIMGIVALLQVLGISFTLLIGGSAALLVGVGLGLQQTFNDLISGIIILVEGTVKVGDIVKVDGFVAKMRKIGLRVSEIETRDNSVLLIPNSKLVVENVNNWSHYVKPTRFQVTVGVSYTSDVRLVERLLLKAANEHTRVSKKPKPRVQFRDFGNSSLDFMLHFYSTQRMTVEFTKSDIRFNITRLFRENGIEIPFPQQDLWLRNPESLRGEKQEVNEEFVDRENPNMEDENKEEDKDKDLPLHLP